MRRRSHSNPHPATDLSPSNPLQGLIPRACPAACFSQSLVMHRLLASGQFIGIRLPGDRFPFWIGHGWHKGEARVVTMDRI